MAKQEKRVVINVTPEQQAAVDKALDIAMKAHHIPSKNAALVHVLERLCDLMGVEFPDNAGKWGDIERIPSRQKRKKSEPPGIRGRNT